MSVTFSDLIARAFPNGIPGADELEAMADAVVLEMDEPELVEPVRPPKVRSRPKRGTPEYAEFVKDMDPMAVRAIEVYEDTLEDLKHANRPGGRLIRAAELMNRPAPVWLVGDTVPETGVGQIYGPTYSGKTYVALDLALSVANGKTEWFGRPIGRSGPVVYVLMEGSWDFGRRVSAWLSINGGTADNLYVLDEEDLNLADSGSVRLLERDITEVGISPVMVVVDTQALATAGVEENSNTDMGLVFANLKKLARKLGAFVWTVHHTGHDTNRARGASAQKAALDVEMSVKDGVVDTHKIKAWQPWSTPEPFRIGSAAGSAVVFRGVTLLDLITTKGGRTARELAQLTKRRQADVVAELADLVVAGSAHVVPAGQRREYFSGPGD